MPAVSAERFARIKELFLACSELEAHACDAYLEAQCADDDELRQEVLALVAQTARAAPQLSTDVVLPAQRELLEEFAGDEVVGKSIGPYQLLEQIGEGGMGVVYVAEQKQPLKRYVALKLIKPGMDSRQVIARFEAERQALAMMDHPHIARVFDGGTTAQGRPYFVMELVRGVPITEFCDAERFPIRRRLEQFQQVCQAVQHAHQKGIIHRDLKPSNVLVSWHDDVPVVKIIDFGIAKAMGQQLTDKTIYTQFAQLMGTPVYMSPEQARMSGLDVDTRSDIYSLGVLLYELLTGTTPFDPATLKEAGLDEMRRVIREVEPAQPSQRIATLKADASSTISERRGVDPRRLNHIVRGELDWITVRCLEKDRTRRYQTAGELAEDVGRYLDDAPVAASPPSRWYHLRKWGRRHRAAIAVATLLMITLVSATAVSLWQAQVASLARIEAEEALQESETAGTITEAVFTFFVEDVLASSSPEHAPQGLQPDANLRMRTVLDRAAAAIDGKFADQPMVEGKIRQVIGRSYSAIGDYDLAATHARRAVDLLQTEAGNEDEATLAARTNLAVIIGKRGDLPKAERMLREVGLQMMKSDPRAADIIEVQVAIAAVQYQQGKLMEAEDLLRQILDRQHVLGGDHPAIRTAKNNYALVLYEQERYEEAEALLLEVFWQERALNGELHPAAIATMHNLGELYDASNRILEAEQWHSRCLLGMARVYGMDHPLAIPAMHSLATWKEKRAGTREAMLLHGEAWKRYRESEGPHDPVSRKLALDYARVALFKSRFDLAAAPLSDLLEARQWLCRADLLVVLEGLARVCVVQEEYQEAQALLAEALELRRQGTNDAITHDMRGLMQQLCQVHLAAGNLSEAEIVARQLVECHERGVEPGWPSHQYLLLLAEVLGEQQRFAECEALLMAYGKSEGSYGDWGAAPVVLLGTALHHQGKSAAAAVYFQAPIAARHSDRAASERMSQWFDYCSDTDQAEFWRRVAAYTHARERAKAHFHRGNLAEALEQCRIAWNHSDQLTADNSRSPGHILAADVWADCPNEVFKRGYLELLNEQIRRHPRNPKLRLLRAELCLANDRPADASEDLELALDSGQSFSALYPQAALAALAADNEERHRRVLERMMTDFERLGRRDFGQIAIRMLVVAPNPLLNDPRVAKMAERLPPEVAGWLLIRQGKYAEAKPLVCASSKYRGMTWEPIALYWRAMLEHHLGQANDARRTFDEARSQFGYVQSLEEVLPGLVSWQQKVILKSLDAEVASLLCAGD